jgi:hypothetical protein
MPSSGVWRHVDVVDWTDVSEDRIASIFRVEEFASEEPACEQVAAELSLQLHSPVQPAVRLSDCVRSLRVSPYWMHLCIELAVSFTSHPFDKATFVLKAVTSEINSYRNIAQYLTI